MRVICSVLFLIFVFVYLFFYGGDILVIEQHIASEGATHYDYFIGAVLLSLFLYGIQIFTNFLVRLRGISYALTYFPSLMILSLITDVSFNFTIKPTANANWGLFLLLVASWAAMVYIALRYQSIEGEVRKQCFLNQLTFYNVLILNLLFLVPCTWGNHDKIFHRQIYQEFLITHGYYTEALNKGRIASPKDKRQAMINAYCLVQKHALADSLFSLNIPYGMTTLTPGKENGHFYLIPDSVINLKMQGNRDVLLCKRLLSRQLHPFVSRLNAWYSPESRLPRHFKEAIALCRKIHPNLVEKYPQGVTDSIFVDFEKFRAKHATDSLLLKYQNTYWAYFFRIK